MHISYVLFSCEFYSTVHDTYKAFEMILRAHSAQRQHTRDCTRSLIYSQFPIRAYRAYSRIGLDGMGWDIIWILLHLHVQASSPHSSELLRRSPGSSSPGLQLGLYSGEQVLLGGRSSSNASVFRFVDVQRTCYLLTIHLLRMYYYSLFCVCTSICICIITWITLVTPDA